MLNYQWEIKRGDLVKITSPDGVEGGHSYGIVMSEEPFADQLTLFPAVVVYSFLHGLARQYYSYSVQIVSAAP